MSDDPSDDSTELTIPGRLPVLPLKSTVVFPRIFIPLSVGRRRSLKLLEDLPAGDRFIAVAAQLDEAADEVGFEDLYHVGVMVRIQHMLKLPDGTVQLAVLGLRRIKLTAADGQDPYLVGSVTLMPEAVDKQTPIEREALVRRSISSFQQLVTLSPHLPAELATAAGDIASTYISKTATNQITITHPASSGRTWNIHCTAN